jgi:hypothetical protein
MDYSVVPNLALQSDIVDISYIPGVSGTAYLVARHQLGRVASTGSVAEVHDFDSVYLERIAFGSNFDGALLIGWETTGSGGNTSTQGKLYRVDPETDEYEELEGSPLSGMRPVAIVPDPGGGFYVLSRSSSTYQTHYLHKVSNDGSVQIVTGHTGSAGATDAVWVQSDGILFGEAFVLVVAGYNGADSWSYVPALSQVVDNAWPNSFGNAGRVAWRPFGDYGLVNATSTNKVYTFDGSWDMFTLPTAGSAITTNDVTFSPSGNLAIFVGRSFQDQGTVVVQQNVGDGVDTAVYSAWGIPGFFGVPYNADSNTHLLSVAFQPDSLCGQGLIGSSVPFGQSLSLLIRFHTAPCD